MSGEIEYTFVVEIPEGTNYTADEKAKILSINSHPSLLNCDTRDAVKQLILETHLIPYYIPGYIVRRVPK